jgi:putative phosphoserine phosphatase/1-acylglycerol-3-phosphate O-acyltransferase
MAVELGTDFAVGTRFEMRGGRFTGRSRGPVCIDQNKPAMAQGYLQARGIAVDLSRSAAYADSVTDAPLLELVGHPVAVYPDPGLRSLAEKRSWRIFPGAA